MNFQSKPERKTKKRKIQTQTVDEFLKRSETKHWRRQGEFYSILFSLCDQNGKNDEMEKKHMFRSLLCNDLLCSCLGFVLSLLLSSFLPSFSYVGFSSTLSFGLVQYSLLLRSLLHLFSPLLCLLFSSFVLPLLLAYVVGDCFLGSSQFSALLDTSLLFSGHDSALETYHTQRRKKQRDNSSKKNRQARKQKALTHRKKQNNPILTLTIMQI